MSNDISVDDRPFAVKIAQKLGWVVVFVTYLSAGFSMIYYFVALAISTTSHKEVDGSAFLVMFSCIPISILAWAAWLWMVTKVEHHYKWPARYYRNEQN